MTLTELSIKRPTLIVVIFSVLTILGITTYLRLNYELIPKLNFPAMSVVTMYPGASAPEVESNVTKILEDALSTLDNVKSMKSTSQEGVSTISIELDADADADIILQNAQRKVNAVVAKFPVGVRSPAINKFSSDEVPVLKLSVTANMPPTELYSLMDNQIKPQFSKLSGVGQVSLVGGTKREIKVRVSKQKLDTYKISIGQIYQAVSAANMEVPTGKIESELTQYTVRLVGKFKSLDELRSSVITRNQAGSLIRLEDIAEIADGYAEQTNVNKLNGDNSIGVIIQKQSDANTVDVCESVKKQLVKLEEKYTDKKLKFDVASDSSIYTLASANAVMEDLMIAILLVAFVMFIFLHSFRNSFIVLISIPSSIISVFTAMYIFDFTLNMLTLMGLSLVIGILVDDSIVVLENIYRHLEMKKERKQAALDGRNEIGFTAVAITLVDVVVFLPLSLVSGMIGNMLKEFSLVVVFSTLMSLFVSFTITPLLASRFSSLQRPDKDSLIGRFSSFVERNLNQLTSLYEKVLRWGLNHRKTVYLVTTLLVVLSFGLVGAGLIGTAFMNNGDRGEFVIKLEGEARNSLHQTTLLTQQVEDLLLAKPEVVKVFSNIGFSTTDFGAGSGEKNKSEITVTLVPAEERELDVTRYAAMIKKEVQAIPGLKVTSTPVSLMGSADDAPIQVLLRSSDSKQLFRYGDSIMNLLRDIPGTNDIKLSIEQSNPEVSVRLDREKMQQLGVNVQQVAATLNYAFAGNTDLKYSEGDEDYAISILLDQFDRNNIADLASLTVINSRGEPVYLENFTSISQILGPNKLERYDRIPSLTVKCSVFGRPIGTVGKEVKAIIKKKIKTNEVTIDYKGQMEKQAEAFGGLFTALFAALIFVYLIMVALYNSYLYPFVVMFSIPVAVVGALLALAISGESLTIYSMIGMIMLIGLVAKNAILLVDFTNKLKSEGYPVVSALVEAGKERLRPILMTTLAMIVGMLPIALASGAGAESKNGLAWAIIGGLTSSLLLTLVLVPAVYLTLENYKAKVTRRLGRK